MINQIAQRRLSSFLLLFATLSCFLQIAWFWKYFAHNVTMDGVNYIGLARHLLDGDFKASLHGYWSPLLSWLIAAGGFFTRDLTLLAQLITLASMLLCLPLLYLLTFKLWHSALASAFAVLWFSLARGIVAGAFATIQADFLFTACTLIYFSFLISCLRQGTRSQWFLLGAAHAAAFLAKAFAMPWLSISTVLGVLLGPRKSLKHTAASLLLAFLMPAIVWLSWGEALKSKYGFFTAGFQLKNNLMVDLKRSFTHYERGNPYAFVDTSPDRYMVGEPPIAEIRQFRMTNPELVPVIFKNELRNVPAALKEIVILLTPGGVLGLIFTLTLLIRSPASHRPETVFCWISMVSLCTLIAAYGMLVFDTRYVLPTTPILMAIAAVSLVSGNQPDSLRPPAAAQRVSLGLLVLSTIFFMFYWASPFRTVDRNFQLSCRHAASLIAQHHSDSLVSIGEGPYPEHGIGFEVGVYVAYLSGGRLVAMNAALPDVQEVGTLTAAVLEKKSDAVLVWGKPANGSYQEILSRLRNAPHSPWDEPILDPTMGEVGRVVFFQR